VDSTGKITYAPANLLLQSQTFDNASWVKSATTVTANTTVAPDGTSTADTLLDTAATSSHYTYQTPATLPVAGNTVTISAYAKASTLTYVTIGITDISSGSLYAVGVFNLSNGTVATSGAAGTGYSVTSTTITSAGDGWYRCSVTCVVGTSAAFIRATVGTNKTGIISAGSGGFESYLGNGSGIFLWGAQLEPVTYQTTPSTYVATTSAAYYGPRFDYDPVTLAAKGLLIEEQRTNLLTYSEQFDNASWIKINSTVTANAATSPDGTANAEKLVENTANAQHFVLQIPSATASTAYTFTVYLKAAERTRAALIDSGGSSATGVFDLSSGAVVSTSNCTASVSSSGNGWYRCSITFTSAVGQTGVNARVFLVNTGTNTTYTGDGTSGIFVYGAQLEAGAFATSYIPTVASQVTRSADVATMTGTNFSSWYNQSEGTFVADASSTASSARSLTASAGAVTDQLFLQSGAATSIAFNVFTASAFVAQLGSLPASLIKKVAGAYKVNDFAASVNGGTVDTDTSGALATYSQLNLGANALGSGGFLNGHIRSIAYYNTRLPNATLQALTA
jgi:hypothetical protein